MTRGRGWVSAAMLSACSLFGLREARADAKQECAAAYEQTQSLRDSGKLIDARKNALACTVPACPGFIVKECTQWLTQIDAILPSVVFEVHDPSGAETGAAQVSLDGKPWLEGLDGKAKPIDPGPHVLRFTLAGAQPHEETVQIREGEKVRKLTVSLQKAAAPQAPGPVQPGPLVAPPPATPPPAAPVADQGSSGSSVAPWIVGGVGVAGLVVGGVLGGLVLHDKSVATDPTQCSTALMKCTTAGANAEQQGRTLGPATTIALAVGGAGVAVGAVLLGLRAGKRPQASGLVVRAEVTASGLRLRGSF